MVQGKEEPSIKKTTKSKPKEQDIAKPTKVKDLEGTHKNNDENMERGGPRNSRKARSSETEILASSVCYILRMIISKHLMIKPFLEFCGAVV